MRIYLALGIFVVLTISVFASPEVIRITQENGGVKIKIGLEEDHTKRIIESTVYISSKANPASKDIYRFLGLRDHGKTEIISGKKKHIVWALYKDLIGGNSHKNLLNQKYLYVAFGTNITPVPSKFLKYRVLNGEGIAPKK